MHNDFSVRYRAIWQLTVPFQTRDQTDASIKLIKVFRYSFSEAILIFFNRIKSGFFPCPIAIKFSPVIGHGLKFVKM